MSHANGDVAARDQRLNDLILAYLEAAEAGQAPDPHSWQARHPEYAAELAAFVADFDRLDRLAAPLRAISANGANTDDGPTRLGDFKLIREVGRGGMGVVYEAEQVSLGRRVALKVLPFAAALDGRQLQRFKTEAQAAACLHHSNIVPVFFVGCDRGVHYYAMQFIDGRTLADVIRELRVAGPGGPAAVWSAASAEPATAAYVQADAPPVPTDAPAAQTVVLSSGSSTKTTAFFQTVARLGIQAAEALDSAHQLGVVHRDVKPANLMVDDRGHLWVTDFGLARLGTDAGVTVTGDLLGTYRYMSPEQALAKRIVIDHRTDIYSLGATLYELLTQQPAFNGRDRNEVLRQISFEEPKPPRRLNRPVPAELETIVLKAMAKDPNGRYATAQELADDLRRWLAHEPIKARRPSLVDHARKWARRHRTLVGAAAGVLVLAVVGLSIGITLIRGERDIARAHQSRSEERERFARQVVNRMYSEVASKWLAQEPHQQALQRQFLTEARDFFQKLSEDSGAAADPALARERAVTLSRLGAIEHGLGDARAAEKTRRQALVLFEQIAKEAPDEPARQHALACGYYELAGSLHMTGRLAEANGLFRKAVGLLERVVADVPKHLEYQDSLQSVLNDWSINLDQAGQGAEAEQVCRRALRSAEDLARERPKETNYHKSVAAALNGLANFHLERGDWGAARQLLERAIVSQQVAIELNPRQIQTRTFLAKHYRQLAMALEQTREFAAASQALRQAVSICERLAADYPEVPGHQMQLVELYCTLANRLISDDQASEAEAVCGKALALLDRVTAQHADDDSMSRLALVHFTLARVKERTGQKPAAEEHYRQSLALRRQLVSRNPATIQYHSEVGATLHNLANLLAPQKKWPEYVSLLEQAVVHQEKAVQVTPKHPTYRQFLSNHYVQLAWFFAACPEVQYRDPRRAVELFNKAFEFGTQKESLWVHVGMAHFQIGDWRACVTAFQKGLPHIAERNAWDYRFMLAMAHWHSGDQAMARQQYELAVQSAEKHHPNDAKVRRMRAEAANLLGVPDSSATTGAGGAAKDD